MRCSGLLVVCFTGLLTFVSAGCAKSGPELGDVTGTITLDGQPVRGLAITFRPAGPGASTSYGGTNAEGKYTLMFTRDRNGAMPGDYEVDLEVIKNSKGDGEAKSNEPAEPPLVLPKKYKQPGALKATVKAGKNTIDFPLESK